MATERRCCQRIARAALQAAATPAAAAQRYLSRAAAGRTVATQRPRSATRRRTRRRSDETAARRTCRCPVPAPGPRHRGLTRRRFGPVSGGLLAVPRSSGAGVDARGTIQSAGTGHGSGRHRRADLLGDPLVRASRLPPRRYVRRAASPEGRSAKLVGTDRGRRAGAESERRGARAGGRAAPAARPCDLPFASTHARLPRRRRRRRRRRTVRREVAASNRSYTHIFTGRTGTVRVRCCCRSRRWRKRGRGCCTAVPRR